MDPITTTNEEVSTKTPATKRAAKKAVKAPGKAAKGAKATKAAKAAKTPKAAEPREPGAPRLVPANLESYVRDTEHKTAGGHVSVHCGDEVAEKLLGKSLDQVYAMAAKALKEDEKALRAKYKNLNVGMQRMNLGNRIRGALQKAAA